MLGFLDSHFHDNDNVSCAHFAISFENGSMKEHGDRPTPYDESEDPHHKRCGNPREMSGVSITWLLWLACVYVNPISHRSLFGRIP